MRRFKLRNGLEVKETGNDGSQNYYVTKGSYGEHKVGSYIVLVGASDGLPKSGAYEASYDGLEEIKEKVEMEVKDFKIGKKYKKVGGGLYLGEIGECIKTSNFSATINIGNSPDYSVYNQPEHWELVVEPIEETVEFKTGDMIVTGTCHFAYVGTTSEGKIITVSESAVPYNSGEGDYDLYIWEPRDWKLATPPEPIVVDTTREVTLSDIAKAMNINVKDLKIVD